MTKKGDTVSVYRYKDIPIPTGLSTLPKSIAYKIVQRNKYEIQGVVPDINFYFNPVYLKADKLLGFWEQVSILKPWLLLDDLAEGKGCKLDENNIYDGEDANFYLLTKNNIKRLYFYAPLYYEKLCPGRSGRQNIIKIEEVFQNYFKE